MGMVLDHGAFPFPVGVALDVEDFKYLVPNPDTFCQRAIVVENRRESFRLLCCAQAWACNLGSGLQPGWQRGLLGNVLSKTLR